MIRSVSIGLNTMDAYDFEKTMYPGGNQLNTAVYAKWAGADSAYIGYFSDDERGRHIKNVLKKNGVEISRSKTLHGQCGYAMTTLVNGNRTFHGTRKGVNSATPIVLDNDDLDYIKQFDVVVSDCYSNLDVTQIKKIRSLGVPMVYDFSEEFTAEVLERLCPYTDYCFLSCNRQGGKDDIKNLLRKICGYGPKIAVGTRGALGQIVFDGEQFYDGSATPATVVDTMGAGDSFTISFTISYLSGYGHGQTRIINAMKFASEFAARVCGINGSVGEGLKYQGDLEDLYSKEDGYSYCPYKFPLGGTKDQAEKMQ